MQDAFRVVSLERLGEQCLTATGSRRGKTHVNAKIKADFATATL
jgi:hypothetical protein